MESSDICSPKKNETSTLLSRVSLELGQALRSSQDTQMQYSNYRIDKVTVYLIRGGLQKPFCFPAATKQLFRMPVMFSVALGEESRGHKARAGGGKRV